MFNLMKDQLMESVLKVKTSDKHQEAKGMMRQLELLLKERQELIDDPDVYIYEFFRDIRNEIDLTTETHVKEVYDQRDEMLNRLSQLEAECMQKAKELKKERNIHGHSKLSSDVFEETLRQFNEWNDKINQIQLPDNFAEEIHLNATKKLKYLKVDLKESKSSLLQKKNISYKPNLSTTIGKLYIENKSFRLFYGVLDGSIKVTDSTFSECITELKGHSDYVRHFQLSESNDRLFSCSQDKTVRVWDLTTFKCIKVLGGHTDIVCCLQLLPDNKTLFSASLDKTIRVWDLSTFECIKVLNGHSAIVYFLQFSSTRNSLFSSSVDKTIRIWDLLTLECTKILKGHTNTVCCLQLLSDGTKLFSGSTDKTIRVWDLSTSKCIKVLTGHTDSVMCFCSIDNKLFSGDHGGTIRVWNETTFKCIKELTGHTGWVINMQISSRENMLLSCSTDKSIKSWDLTTLEFVKNENGPILYSGISFLQIQNF